MAKQIKILESEGSTPKFQDKVNEHLNKGWKIKGGLVYGAGGLAVLLFKK